MSDSEDNVFHEVNNDNVDNASGVNGVANGAGVAADAGPSQQNRINSVFGKLPFPKLNSKFNVESWFIKVDAWFELNGFGVRKEKEKYTAVVAHAEDYVLDQVFDLVRTQPLVTPYTTLKKAIIDKFSESAMARLDKLTSGIQLGDGKPSHLLSQLQRTNATSDETVVRRYWIKRLPPAARAVIVGMLEAQPNTPLSQLAITADAVLDSLGDTTLPSSSNTNTRSDINAIGTTDERVNKLEKRINSQEATLQQINNKLAQLLTNDRGRQRDRSQNNSTRSNTPHRSKTAEGQRNSSTCWFHREYGTKARKCLSPCDFSPITAPKN